MVIVVHMCKVLDRRWVVVKMLLRDGSGRPHPVSIPADQPPQPRRTEQASIHSALLRRDAYQDVSSAPPADCCRRPWLADYIHQAHVPAHGPRVAIAWPRGFCAAEHSLLHLLNRHTLSHLWLAIRPKRPRTLCTVHHHLLRVPGPLAVPLKTFQAMQSPLSDSNYGKY